MLIVLRLSPIIVVALSIIFLKEFVDKKIWFAIFFGFIGVLIILRPGFEVFSFKALLPLGAALGFAVYQILTKKVSEYDSNETSLFFTSLFGVVVMLVLASIFWVDFIFIILFFTSSHRNNDVVSSLLFNYRTCKAPANKIQPFHFSLIFWAIILWFCVL